LEPGNTPRGVILRHFRPSPGARPGRRADIRNGFFIAKKNGKSLKALESKTYKILQIYKNNLELCHVRSIFVANVCRPTQASSFPSPSGGFWSPASLPIEKRWGESRVKKGFGVLGFLVAFGSIFRVASFGPSDQPLPNQDRPRTQLALAGLTCGPSNTDDNPSKAVRQVFADRTKRSGSGGSCVSWDCVPPHSAEFMLATLADPDQTHLSLNFDRALESLMWAIEDSGFAFEAYWLPWTTASVKGLASFTDWECFKKQKEERRKQPGLLIFRSIATKDHYLFVWLSGETPTSGIDQVMFEQALAYSRVIDPALTHFRILGPNFSGSLEPFLRELKTVDIPGAYFQIVSGAATNLRAITEFRNGLQLAIPQRSLGIFESAIENDKQAFDLFVNYSRTQFSFPWLPRLGNDETAVLSEDETIYGDLGLDWPASQNDHHRWMMLRYPREIARLRNASPQDSLPNPPPDARRVGVGSVPFTLRDPAVSEESHPDSVSTFSQEQSPVSQQAILLTIASTLRRERSAYTGIVATDVLDSVFLAHFLHNTSPDMRLFSIDADLLFLREAESEPLYGMLAVTTYPLFSRNQHWTVDELKLDHMPRRVQFASRYAQGIYNACRRLIVPRGTNSSAPDTFLEYERPSERGRQVPPLWLTVVGRDGYWPVALLDESKKIDGKDSTITNFSPAGMAKPTADGEKFHPEEPSRAWRLLFSLSCLFCFAHAFYMANILSWTAKVPEEAKSLSRLRNVTNRLHHIFSVYPDDHPPDQWETPFLLTATLSLFSSLLLFSFPLVPFLAYTRFQTYFAVSVVCLAFLLYFAVRLTLREFAYKRIIRLAWTLSIPFLGIWVYLNLRPDYHSGEFFAYRALYLGNAVSPGIPIVLLAVAFYGWAWMHLHRESEVRNRREVRPKKDDFESWPWPEKLSRLIIGVDDAIENIQAADLWVPALGSLILWFLVLYPPESLRTFEFYPYDFLYWSILAGLYWCISLVLVQFVRCWRQLRKLLEALERHPVRRAFSRLDKEISWIPLVSTVPARSLIVSVRSFDCLRAIHAQNLRLTPDPTIEECLKEIAVLEEEIQSRVAKRQPFNDLYKKVQNVLDKSAKHLWKVLTSTRWEKGYSESIANELRLRQRSELLEDREKLTLLQEEFIALRFLIFIRYVLRQLRNWLGFIVAGFIISTISMNSYPFQAHRWIGLASLITFLAIGTVAASVFAEMDRDAILSRLSNTNANELGVTFFLRLARFGGLPLLTLLAAQFPSINRVLFFWVKPAFDAIK
jgi:hypothetical protein